jgi:hypothetical protein
VIRTIVSPRIALLLVTALGCGNVAAKSDARQAGPDGCAPGAFLSCSDPMTEVTCSATGNGTTTTACGTSGCNADAGRCNQCTPSTLLCSADGKTLETCDATGNPQPMTSCSLSCVDATSTTPARCAHIDAPYVAGACDTPATTASVNLTGGTIDPGLDASCTMIISQATAEICVVRADSITITSTVTVVGRTGSEPNRVIAFVADHDLVLSGTIDLSAHGASPGPGGGASSTGAPGASTAGGGGAGSFTAGGNGANDTNGNGGAGGAAIAPPLVLLTGGPSAASCSGNACLQPHTFGGGGGGGLMLASCLGTVTVSGEVNVAGGGGQGARVNAIAGTIFPPQGGGAGGNVVIAGVHVNVSGSLFANGGGGGGGCNGQTGGLCPGGNGGDGQQLVMAASGGTAGTGATGGSGGFGTTTPGIGVASGQIPAGPGGGGGGAAGHLQVYTPQGIAPTIAPSQVSPPFDPPLTVTTH